MKAETEKILNRSDFINTPTLVRLKYNSYNSSLIFSWLVVS